MSPEDKEQILARVESWLEEWDLDELPEGLDPRQLEEPEAPPDLATLAAAIAASTQELRLQGRAFQRLQDEVASAREAPPPGESGPSTESDELMDVYDRLQRAMEESAAAVDRLAAPARWLGAGRVCEGLIAGLALVCDRLDAMLAGRCIQPIVSTGRAFDPESMHAVGAVAFSGKLDGQVIATVRTGFRSDQRIVRPAQVMVAKAAEGST